MKFKLIIIMSILNLSVMAKTKYDNFFPSNEIVIILDVAKEYHLSVKETDLLFVIRRIENAGCLRINEFGKHVRGVANGMQMGAGGNSINHPARRYRGNFERSLRLQAQWTAGTIQKRYRSSGLRSFSRRWCPPNHTWWHQTAKQWLNKIK